MKTLTDKTLIFAHRGASAYEPDNTMEAFELATKMGADGIELDVRLTKDGQVVIFHDSTLDRMTNMRGTIPEYTLAELKAMDFGYGFFKNKRTNYKIATLDEVYELVAPLDIVVNVEIKEKTPEIIGVCAEIAKRHNMQDKLIYSCFNHYQIRKVKEQIPDAFIAPLHAFNLLDPWDYCLKIGAKATHPDKAVLKQEPDFVKNCHDNGIRVHTWTVDEPEDIQLCLDMGVDVIMTNHPDVAVEMRNKTK